MSSYIDIDGVTYNLADSRLCPSTAEFIKIITRFTNYLKHGSSSSYIETPWGLSHSIKDDIKALRYTVIATIIGWDDLIKILVRDHLVKGLDISKSAIPTIIGAIIKENLTKLQGSLDEALTTFAGLTLDQLLDPTTLKLDESLTEGAEKHETLNPLLFNKDEKLKPEVIEKCKKIAEEFLKGLAEDGIKINIKDIVAIGSNVSYNYTDHSDLDLHILADTSSLACPDNLYPLLYSAYRSLFNNKLDISFYGIPVEIYVETDDTPRVSNGEYSILKNDWNKKPVAVDIPEIDEDEFERALDPWETRYERLVRDKNISVAKIEKFINDLYMLRKAAIADEGEYAIGNLVFKEFRNLGKLDELKDIKNDLKSEQMSLESLAPDSARIDERLVWQQIDKFTDEIKNITHKFPLVLDTGSFTVYEIPSTDVEEFLAKIRRLEFVDCAYKFPTGYKIGMGDPKKIPADNYYISGLVKQRYID